MEEFEIEGEVVLIFRIGIETIGVDCAGKIMIDDFAVNDSITEIFDFHFGARVGNDLFDPAEDGSLGGHGAGSTGFLKHGFDEYEEWIIIIYE